MWSDRTVRTLQANLHQFEPVSLRRTDHTAFDRRHYHRLNEDYELMHDLCRLFLDRASISEKRGRVRFRGFLLDMNELFEKFVTQAFVSVSRVTGFNVQAQKSRYMSEFESDFSVAIRPDVTVHYRGDVVSIIDAKYKRTLGTFENHDFYQMLAYGTSLNCPRTYLFYPTTEYDVEGRIQIRNAPVTISVRRINIGDKRCVDLAEEAAVRVLDEVRTKGNLYQDYSAEGLSVQ